MTSTLATKDNVVVEESTETESLIFAIRNYQAETNQIANLLAQHSEGNQKIDRRLLTHVLGTTNSYLDAVLGEIV